MKVAHLIMAYKNPSQLEKLVERLYHPACDVFIHLDKKVDISNYQYIGRQEKVSFINDRRECNWGGFSFVVAITNSLKEILASTTSYDYINLLSGQDYPIKPTSYFYNFLEKNKGKSFMSFDEDSNSDWWQHAVTRYQNYHFTDYNVRGRYRAQAFLNRWLPKRKFPLPWKLYGSSNASWWTITAQCAAYIADVFENNPKLLDFMKLSWAADEFLYTSIIMNSLFKDAVVNNNLRYIEWIDGQSNPKILLQSDINALKASEHFFARKFDVAEDQIIFSFLDQWIVAQEIQYESI